MHRTLGKGRGEGYGRPAILKPEDIQAMDDNDEEEEGGWAGAQDEVDYAAKLDFEDFDEDEKPSAENSKERSNRDTSVGEPESRWQSHEGKTVSSSCHVYNVLAFVAHQWCFFFTASSLEVSCNLGCKRVNPLTEVKKVTVTVIHSSLKQKKYNISLIIDF